MAKQYRIRNLSQNFFNDYPSTTYPEIENKANRPYAVMLLKVEDNTFAIPFRTNIKHKASYKFSKSSRSTQSSTGLDYSKAVIVNDPKYIGQTASIDNDEYVELDANFHTIFRQFEKYVKNYEKFLNNDLSDYEAKKYKYSTLQYYHKELGLEQNKTTQQQNIVENKSQSSNINYCGASDCNTTDIANKLSESSKPKTRYDT